MRYLAVTFLAFFLMGAITSPLNPKIDSVSGSEVSISFPHHELHEGDTYVASTSATIGAASEVIISFRTPNTAKWLHMLVSTDVTGGADLEILEAPTITDDTGSTLAIYNRNRNSANTSGVFDTSPVTDLVGSATLDSTITADGTVLVAMGLGSGQNQGAQQRGTSEFILKPNSLYAFRITSSSANNVCNIVLTWYEHTNSE